MNKMTTGKRSTMRKAVCTVMILLLCAGIFGGAAMGSGGCGIKCCCQTGPSHMKSSAVMQMRSQMGCCSGGILNPCDLQGTEPVELPELVLTPLRENPLNSDDSTPSLPSINDYGQQKNKKTISQTQDAQFNSPPIYLQKLSFLI